MAVSKDSFKARRSVDLDGVAYDIFSLPALARAAGFDLDALPYSRRVLLENLVRHEDGDTVDRGAILGLANAPGAAIPEEIAFHPARVLMPDSSGGPLLVDLAAMRDALVRLGRDPTRVNPVVPVDFVVDHSAVAEYAGSADAIERNLEIEFDLNRERYGLIKWAQQALRNFRVVPPGNGILHQINLEYLARVVRVEDDHGGKVALVDTLVGMDSHTPTVNGLAVVGWGVGGIEAASVMLGEPVTMLVPRVVGCRLTERLRPGITATDLVLTLTLSSPRRRRLLCRVLRARLRHTCGARSGNRREHGARIRGDDRVFSHRRADHPVPAPDRAWRGALPFRRGLCARSAAMAHRRACIRSMH